jgi:hypothetical protein
LVPALQSLLGASGSAQARQRSNAFDHQRPDPPDSP